MAAMFEIAEQTVLNGAKSRRPARWGVDQQSGIIIYGQLLSPHGFSGLLSALLVMLSCDG